MLATALAGYAGWVLIYTFPEETKQQTEASTRDERE
jgi:hypothetical protein